MQKTLIDAGPLIALFDRDDAWHIKVREFLKGFKGELFTTWPVVTEVLHMLDFNSCAQLDFLRWLQRDSITILSPGKESLDRIIQLTKEYSDLPMDFADATLLAASETTGISNIITIDSDFFVYRSLRKKMLRNILLPDCKDNT